MLTYLRSINYRPAIKERPELQRGSWVRCEEPTTEEKSVLVELGIDEDILTDALDPHEVPRIDVSDGWVYFITRVPDIGDDFNDFTTPIMFALGKQCMATVSRDKLGHLWQPFIEKTAVPTTQQTKLFITMIDMIAQSYQNRVALINRQMRAVTNDIAHLRPRDIATIVEYERKLNDYLDALIPTNTAIEMTLGGKLLRLYKDDMSLVEDLSVDLEQVITRCKSLLRTITNVRDSYRAVMDTRLNETMRILTVATLVLTIPTMIAGLFGMNVSLPVDHDAPEVFWIIILVCVIAGGGVSLYFLKKR